MPGLGLAILGGALEGAGQGFIERAQQQREDAIRAWEAQREDAQLQQDRAWELEDQQRERDWGLEDRRYEENLAREGREAALGAYDAIYGPDSTAAEAFSYTPNAREAAVIAAEFGGLDVNGEPLSADAIAAFLGNLHVESNFNAGALGDRNLGEGREAHHMGQWREERWENLQRFSRESGIPLDDPRIVPNFIVWELENSESAAWEAIKAENPQTPEEWAYALAKHYWRPAEPGNPARQRAALSYAEAMQDPAVREALANPNLTGAQYDALVDNVESLPGGPQYDEDGGEEGGAENWVTKEVEAPADAGLPEGTTVLARVNEDTGERRFYMENGEYTVVQTGGLDDDDEEEPVELDQAVVDNIDRTASEMGLRDEMFLAEIREAVRARIRAGERPTEAWRRVKEAIEVDEDGQFVDFNYNTAVADLEEEGEAEADVPEAPEATKPPRALALADARAAVAAGADPQAVLDRLLELGYTGVSLGDLS